MKDIYIFKEQERYQERKIASYTLAEEIEKKNLILCEVDMFGSYLGFCFSGAPKHFLTCRSILPYQKMMIFSFLEKDEFQMAHHPNTNICISNN